MIFVILTLVVDFIITYFLPLFIPISNYFKPLLFVSSSIIYLIINVKNKTKRRIFLLLGLIYDLIVGKLYFLYLLIFYLLYLEITCLYNKLNRFLLFILSLVSFILIRSIILVILYDKISLFLIIKEVCDNLLLNVTYGIILFYLLGIKKKKA